MKEKKLNIILLALFCIVLSSCDIGRYVPEGKYLVKKNSVVIEKKNTGISKSKLSSYIALKTYKNPLQTKFPIWVYYKSENKPNSKFWKWMNKNFAKEPVYYDKAEADRSASQMTRYLDRIGRFHSKVTHSMNHEQQFAEVHYTVTPTEPYRINKLQYVIEDSLMERFIMRDMKKFPIREGDIYDEFAISDQRDMITERLRNSGYYYFKRDNIHYEVDSNFMNRSMSVTMKVSKNELAHRRYHINKIRVFPDFSVFKLGERPADSVSLTVDVGRRRKLPNTLDFYYYNKPMVRPQSLTRLIQIVQGMPYIYRNVTTTYQKLNNLRIFNNVNITFDSVPSPNDSSHLLDCRITMQQSDRHSFTAQAEGTRSDSDLGIKGSLSYTNNNFFRGAEVFQMSLKGGLEAQKVISLSDSLDKGKIFNTRELGLSTSLLFPKFLSPIPLRNFARDYQPTTTVNLGVNAQIKYYYSRFISTASFSYDWEGSNRIHHTFSPIHLNSVKISNMDSTFQSYLDQQTNQRKKDQYTDHLIFGTRYSFIYSTQNINKTGSFFYLRADLETSGNLLSLFNKTKLMTINENHHDIFGIRYAQYFRSCFDIRQHIDLGRESWLVFREFVGFGLPYGNSEDLPFERSFYAGGANSLRGWNYHGVGPGSFISHYGDFERTGDIQLEANAEVRFPLYNIINGAVFVDAGNVWLYHPNEDIPGGEFKFSEFYKQIALDAGFGLRLDVSFLILRLDLAYAMRNPFPNASGIYWRFDQAGNLKLNFGIGYPF